MSALTRERWRILSPYLDEALEMRPEDRAAWLARLRRSNPHLASDLESLLAEQDALSRKHFLESAIVDRPESPSLVGLRIGAHTLVSPIGSGGMGTVWLAERTDGRFTRKAAVKLLNPALMGHGGEERFTREGNLLARLTHPNIAHLMDAGVTPMGQPYLVLELVEGEHIDQYCTTRGLDVEARLHLFLDVLEAVAHAHANLIVHRDIKPSNVLVRTDGVVKLLDFGIAKLLERDGDDEAPALTIEGARALTPEYAAPEQLTGGAITTATDVHALGVLLYVLLGGPHPAKGTSRSPAELIKVIVETEIPRLSDVVPNGKVFRGDLDNIVAKALKKRPEERYLSVTAFADDIRRYLRREPVSARPDTLLYRTTKFVQRRARLVGASATTAMFVMALTAFYTTQLAAERDRARYEAGKSAKVSELLTSLLSGADPNMARDREPTVRNILDVGAERVQQELADQPELRSEMLTVIGRVYQRLGAYDRAHPLLQEALTLARAEGVETPRLAQALNEFGILVRERGEAAASVRILEEALEMRRRLLGPDDKDIAVTLVELARAYDDAGMVERAEPLLRESLAMRQRLFGQEHRETATSKAELALLLLPRGDLDEAEVLFREALETSRRVLNEDHPNVGAGWNNLGLLLLDKGEFAAAEPMLRRALEIRRKNFGDRHPSLANSMSNLAVSLREQGRLDEAVTLLEDAISITREGLGDRDPSIGRLIYGLGRVHLERHDFRRAEALLRDALARLREILPEAHWRIATTKSTLGGALIGLKRYDEAERLLTQAQATLKDVPGRQGREAALTRARFTQLNAAQLQAR